MIPLLLAVPFGPFLSWKRGDLLGAAQRLVVAMGITVLVVVATFAYRFGGPVLAPLAIGLGAWLILGAISDVAERSGIARVGPSKAFARAVGLPRSAWGAALAHAGLGLTVIGITAATAWGTEQIVAMKPGDSIDVAGYELTYKGTSPNTGPNYTEKVSSFAVAQGGARPRHDGTRRAGSTRRASGRRPNPASAPISSASSTSRWATGSRAAGSRSGPTTSRW